MIQTQFAHTIHVPDEWEHEGHTFQVFQDEQVECPTEWLDSADALCVIGGPHGCILGCVGHNHGRLIGGYLCR